MILFDTSVVSGMMYERRSLSLEAWIARIASQRRVTSALCVSEIRRGIGQMPDTSKRRDLEARFEELIELFFLGIVLPFEAADAHMVQELAFDRRAKGRHVPQIDLMIAATAKRAGARLATRNIGDFKGLGISLIDPWAEESRL